MVDATPSYLVTEGLIGEHPIWRIVRRETDARGMTGYVYVCGCATLRAAMALAGTLGAYREGETPEVIVREGGTGAHRALQGDNSGMKTKLWPVC